VDQEIGTSRSEVIGIEIHLEIAYQDFDTNPANESVDRVVARINHPDGRFYKFYWNGVLAGAIRVYWKTKRLNERTTLIYYKKDAAKTENNVR